jgi:hypothetical protein
MMAHIVRCFGDSVKESTGEICYQDGVGTWRKDFQSRFDKSTGQAQEMKEGARRVL